MIATGTQDKKKVIILAVLLAVVALVLLRDFVSFGGSTAIPAAAVSPDKALQIPDPLLHLSELQRVRSVHYHGSLRNLFEVVQVAEPHVTSGHGPGGGPIMPQPIAPPQPVVQAPPPMPLKFYGFETRTGQAKQVFLQLGDNVYVVTEGQIIEHRYLIGRIDKASVEVRDLQTQQAQTLPLIAG
jgi:hypothetical protein